MTDSASNNDLSHPGVPSDEEDNPDATLVVHFDMLQSIQLEAEHVPFLTAIAGRLTGRSFCVKGGETFIGRSNDIAIALWDDGISRRHAKILLDKGICTLIDLESTNGTFLNGLSVHTPTVLKNGDSIQLGTAVVFRFEFKSKAEVTAQEQLYNAANCDPLTHVFNRRYFDECLAREWAWAQRHKQPCALIGIDLDHFKKVNDSYGHPAGDEVLIATCKTMLDRIREEDILARVGGEEFFVLTRATGKESACILAERLRERIEDLRFEFDGKSVKITASLGVAVSNEVASARELIAKTDEALYTAKNNGRNRVVS